VVASGSPETFSFDASNETTVELFSTVALPSDDDDRSFAAKRTAEADGDEASVKKRLGWCYKAYFQRELHFERSRRFSLDLHQTRRMLEIKRRVDYAEKKLFVGSGPGITLI
jgi:hypothetical protein